MALAVLLGLYYPNQTSPTLSVALDLTDKRPLRPLDPTTNYNVEYDLNAGGCFISRKVGEERDQYELRFRKIDGDLIDELEAMFDQVDKCYRTLVYKHHDATYHTVRWMGPFKYTQTGDRFDIDILLEEEL